MKRFILFVFLVLFLTVSYIYADTYSVKVVNAEYLEKKDDLIELGGNVELDFTVTDQNDKSVKRALSADKVIIDFENKNLNALGSVVLKEGEDSTFSGDAISLDWDALDVLVFTGKSTTDRKNADGKNIKFFSSGKTISYEGSENIIFYTEGVIATQEDEPYWSVQADRLALVESDLFFENAVIKIGRVPIFYFPVFFYPSTTLAFNPAIGFASSKGSFINTTTEIYGKYPNMGKSGSPSSSSSSSSSSTTSTTEESVSDLVPASLFSLLASSDGEEKIRDGIIYRSLKDGEKLSPLQSWAKDTGSYLAVFFDIYSKLGIDVGFDSKNILFDKRLTVTATGVLAYKHIPVIYQDSSLRYYLYLNLNYTLNDLKFSFDLPYLSDRTVRTDFLNRNTAFGLDSVLGGEQYFPNSYGSMDKNKVVLSASWSKKIGNFNFNLKTAEAYIELDIPQTSLKKPEKLSERISEASLPSVVFDSKGSIISETLNSTKEQEQKEKTLSYSSDLANSFTEESLRFEENNENAENNQTTSSNSDSKTGLTPYSFTYTQPKASSKNGSIKLDYDFKQTLDNLYKSKFIFKKLTAETSGNIKLEVVLPDDYFSVTETITPTYTYKKEALEYGEEGDSEINQKLTIKSDFEAKSNFIGLTYKLKLNLYSLNEVTFSFDDDSIVKDSAFMKWDKKDVREHSLDFSKNAWNFTFGLKANLPPLDFIITPKIGFSMYGFNIQLSVPFNLSDDKLFKEGKANLLFKYSNDYMEFSFNNNYDFAKVGSEYSADEHLYLYFLETRYLKFKQEMKLNNKFEFQTFQLGVYYGANDASSNSISISFKDKEFTPNKLNLNLNYTSPEFFFWRNRIGLTGSVGFGFIYDFESKYGSSMNFNISLDFAISELLDLKLSLKSTNNNIYRYYEDDKFKFSLMFEDFWKSFDIFNSGNKQSSFIMDSYSVSLIHYMNDWTLTLTSTGTPVTNNGKIEWKPEFTALIRWNDIPELKTNIRRSEKNDKVIWEKL